MFNSMKFLRLRVTAAAALLVVVAVVVRGAVFVEALVLTAAATMVC